ncbi:MAG: zinc-dependent metalloprotease, partial [Gemmatimonadetes bacterium]|nr:zinc-dependent metalloprotease [Gemmatimonadota bacterium]
PDAAAEAAGLDRILRDGNARNVRFINDTYAGPEGSIPQVTRWDEGTTMFDAVERTAEVRRRMMAAFDERAIQPGEPLALLNMRFTHVYLHHRYSLEAVSKYVGGMDFTFAMRGDGQVPTRVLPAADQRRALGMALDALAPAELTVPERVQRLMVPPAPGFNTDMMWIDGGGGTMFDAVTLAGGLANEVVGYLLHRERAARLVLQQARDAGQLSLDEVLGTIVRRLWAAPAATPSERAVQRAAQRAALDVMLDLAGDRQALPDVRAQVQAQLRALDARLASPAAGAADAAARAHGAAMRRDIARFLAGDDVPAERPRYPVITLPWP